MAAEAATGHRIEVATSSRAHCRSCGNVIKKGDLRFAESITTQHTTDVQTRFHHLACAANSIPLRLRSGLASVGADDPLAERIAPQRQELDAAIARSLSPRVASPPPERDASQYEELVAIMAAQPDDVGPALVLADWLQLEGDPRGELIALQLAKETETGAAWEALEQRTTEHLAKNASTLVPSVGTARLIWKRGFVHRVEIPCAMTLLAGTLEQWSRHPSMRLLRELVVTTNEALGSNLRPLPVTLTKLELRGSYPHSPLGPISDLLLGAPHLRTLVLSGTTDIDRLRHPNLSELAITALRETTTVLPGGDVEVVELGTILAKLTSEALPGLRRLSIDVPPEYDVEDPTLDDACRGLAESALVGALTQIELAGGLGIEGARALVSARADLPKLDVLRVRMQLPRELRAVLQPLCRELLESSSERVLRPAPKVQKEKPRERRVKNRFKPAWGVGRVVSEDDDRIEVEFEAVGLKVIRSPELLVDADD